MDPHFAQQRLLVKSQIEQTWQAASAVEFTGWLSCAERPANIRIGEEDAADKAPHCDQLGRYLDQRQNGMMLNFTFAHWSTDYCAGKKRDFCIKAVATHEFGHALGFAHEQNRPDTPPYATDPHDSDRRCRELAQGRSGDVCFGAWDLASVMNYCNPDWNGNGELSQIDQQMVAYLYGAHPGTVAPPRPRLGCSQTPYVSADNSPAAPSAPRNAPTGSVKANSVASQSACPDGFSTKCCVLQSGKPVCAKNQDGCRNIALCP